VHTGKLTKIVATIGPSSEDLDTIKSLIDAGVNVFRFNTKHNTNEWHLNTINKVKKVAKELGLPIGILVDLQGPEIRIETYEGQPIDIKSGDTLPFVNSFSQVDDFNGVYPISRFIRIPQVEVFNALSVGDTFSIDDGFIDFEIVKTKDNAFTAEAKEDCVLKTRKGLNLVGKDVDLPSLTESDKQRISMAAAAEADFMGLSFVRSAKDILELRKEMKKHNFESKIVAKIESQLGVDNLGEILETADSIMVARGDLGIEVPIERMTHLQKDMIKVARDLNKPVIVATQMLQSMIDSPRPTRAEAADIANAVYDETDATMLSGETASGKYPVKSVATMRKVARYNEIHRPESTFHPRLSTQTHAIISAAYSLITNKHDIKIDKIVVFSETGFTPRVLSSFRPKIPVIAISEDPRTVGSLTLSYGVWPVLLKIQEPDLTYPKKALNELMDREYIKEGDTVLLIHGRHYREAGGTNALILLTA